MIQLLHLKEKGSSWAADTTGATGINKPYISPAAFYPINSRLLTSLRLTTHCSINNTTAGVSQSHNGKKKGCTFLTYTCCPNSTLRRSC